MTDQKPSKKEKALKASKLASISHKYVEDEELRDTPARLFRKILNKMEMNPRKWGMYIRDYLEWIVTTNDPDKAKADRMTKQGNIKDTYFQKPTLSFNKLLEGLSILDMDECEIQLTVRDRKGNSYQVSELIKIMGRNRPADTREQKSE